MSYREMIERWGKAPLKEVIHQDMAELNLICSQGLDDENELLDLNDYSERIERYAKRTRSETTRYRYKFQKNPKEYDYSEAKYRMIMMSTILYEDFDVHYNKAQRTNCLTASNTEFLADSRTAFIRGPMDPNIGGNCGSLPILYAAVGRRLGYPLKIVCSQYHVYLRWVSPGEEFNVEVATEKGVNFYDDDHYRQIDRRINGAENYSVEQEKEEGFFRTLTASEEASIAFRQRTQCLATRGRLREASLAAGAMTRLSPTPANQKALAGFTLAAVHELDEMAKHAVAVPDQNASLILP